MENYRLKVKLGNYEFDAEGPPDVVQAQFAAFQEMVTKLPSGVPQGKPDPIQPSPPESHDNDANQGNGQQAPRSDLAATDAALGKIMKLENRIVSLTATPQSVEDAALLLIYGQRIMRNNESVTGSEIVDGLTATGGLDIGRSERLFEKIARNGDLIMIGERRGKRYRLTNTGINRARQIAASMIALVSF